MPILISKLYASTKNGKSTATLDLVSVSLIWQQNMG